MRETTVNALSFMVLSLVVNYCISIAFADIHVDKNGSQAPDGTPVHPYQLVNSGICKAEPNGTVIIHPGIYNETMVVSKTVKLISSGPVVIGQILGKPHTTIKFITQNTHLFGNQGEGQLPKFADPARADLFAEKVNEENADLVAFQEVWDPELADAIIAKAGYPYRFYSRHYDDSVDFLNSGLLLLSKHPLINTSLTYYKDEANLKACAKAAPSCLIDHPTEPWKCLTGCEKYLDGFASKGFIQTTISKDGFQLGIFITHTQAEEHNAAVEARKKQLEQLSSRIQQYIVENPVAEVVAMGDFNVIGETEEYFQTLLPTVKLRDASRNAPCGDDKPRNTCELSNPLADKFGACSYDQRLDYLLYGRNGRFDLMPTRVEVRKYTVSPAITEDKFTTHNLSDHYGITAEFALLR